MGKYILRRVIYMIPLALCVTLIIFLIMSFTPGDPATNNLPITAEPHVKQAYNESVGYTDSLGTRYLTFLKGLVRGEVLSYSSRNNVFDELKQRYPLTIRLGMLGFLLSSVIGVTVGIISAIKQHSFFDTATTVIVVLFSCVPTFFSGVILLLLFSVRFNWFPSFFAVEQGLRGLVLPTLTTVLGSVPTLSRLTRSSMLSVLNQDYIRTARAKGVPERKVIWKHALKNASFPIIMVLLSGFAGVLGGSVVSETIYSVPGIGTYMTQAISQKNTPGVMLCAFLLSLLYMTAMLLIDITFAIVDPRIRVRYQE